MHTQQTPVKIIVKFVSESFLARGKSLISFFHVVNNHLQSTYCMPGTQIQSGYTKMINTGAVPYKNISLEEKFQAFVKV